MLLHCFGVLTALVAAGVAPLIPYELSLTIGGKAVDNILTILASSMLAVTTFALSASVMAYSSATSMVMPRATQLLVEDAFTQHALSTFFGTFLFSIVGDHRIDDGSLRRRRTGCSLLRIIVIVVIVVIIFGQGARADQSTSLITGRQGLVDLKAPRSDTGTVTRVQGVTRLLLVSITLERNGFSSTSRL
ncbi:DUF2254 family protein [Croceibacterium mercuriale]|uniref:DUF2254 family protein n=1 Tax=Croceibacterium mercuriale TaxID=1572751 RepID=UPI00068B4F80|nr:DUF2254 family protein [Croceibacterium mercuriale]